MFLPSGTIFLIKKDGTKESVMITDLNNESELLEEVNYLFDKCGYKKDNYISAIYQKNNSTTFIIKW